MFSRISQRPSGILLATALLLATTAPASGGLSYNGGSGYTVFGVSPYGGAPVVTSPTYIANVVDGRTDILASPGLGSLGGFLTANPVPLNNISSTGLVALPSFGFQAGSSNGFGPFGQGAVLNLGTQVGLAMADAGAGGNSASYSITGAFISYTVVGSAIPAGSFYGAYLSMAGTVPLVGNADVEALRVHVSDTAGVFGVGGADLPQMVLAISRNGPGSGLGNYNIVTLGGNGGTNAALILDNGTSGTFRALSVDNLTLGAELPLNDVLSVSYTLTAFADPASFSTFDPNFSPDLLSLTGPLPANLLIGTTSAVPEPTSLCLLLLGVGGVLGHSARRRLGL